MSLNGWNPTAMYPSLNKSSDPALILVRSIMNDDVETARQLIEAGTDVKTPATEHWGLRQFHYSVPLVSVANSDNIEMIRLFLTAPGVDLNSLSQVRSGRRTPLLTAIGSGNTLFLDEVSTRFPGAINVIIEASRHTQVHPKSATWIQAHIVRRAKDVRNTRLMGARTGIPEDIEAKVGSFLTGIEGRSSKQQQDMLRQEARAHNIEGARRRKTRRTRRRGTRKTKSASSK
jgi:hypothetical protein